MNRSTLVGAILVTFLAIIATRQLRQADADPAADACCPGSMVAADAAPAAGTPAEQALAQAQAAGQPVVLSFRSNSCLPCQAMSEILAQLRPRYEGRVAFVDVSLEPETPDRALIETYRIQVKPTTFVLTGRGDVAESKLGVWEAPELTVRLDSLVGR